MILQMSKFGAGVGTHLVVGGGGRSNSKLMEYGGGAGRLTSLKLPDRSRAVGRLVVQGRDRGNNRKPLQRGRNLSIEAIQTVQSLKRAAAAASSSSSSSSSSNHNLQLQAVIDSKLRRLIKFDMIAVLRELLRQNECLLSLLVFEDVRKEYWYKPQASLYAEIITVLGSNGLFEKVNFVFSILKTENNIEAKTQDLNALLESLMSCNMTALAAECFYFLKSLGCEPDRSTFKLLVNYLESNGETVVAASIRQEAKKYYGEFLEFLEEQEEVTIS